MDVYPRDPEGDHAKLTAEGVDVVFEPRTLYDDTPGAAPHETYVTVEKLQVRRRHTRAVSRRCGERRADRATRPEPAGPVRRQPAHALPRRGHRGVQAVQHSAARPRGVPAAACAPLFKTAVLLRAPSHALRGPSTRQVFGRKDYQQFKLLCRMVRDLDIGVRMIGAPLVREADGLALSSRNVRLKAEERTRALAISAALRAAAAAAAAGKRDAAALRSDVVGAITAAGGDVDYVEARHTRLVRAWQQRAAADDASAGCDAG